MSARHCFTRWLLRCGLLLAFLLPTQSQALVEHGCGRTFALKGVNLAGGEFNGRALPGVLFKDYLYPTRDQLAYFREVGMTAIRLPVLWERLQRQLLAPLDAPEVARITQVVQWASDMHLCVILDLHNYGRYGGKAVGSADVSAAAFTDVWLRLQKAFPDPKAVALGLMNEPIAVPVGPWVAMAQETLLALRNAGSAHLILVPAGRWSGAHEWTKPFDGISSADAFQSFHDPLNHYAIELHQYADSNYSGTTSNCIAPERLREIMVRVTSWARQNRRQLFLGEFGVARSPQCLDALKAILGPMQELPVWRGWTYWAAGAWWGTYPFSIHPGNGPEAPQLRLMRDFLREP